MKTLLLPGHPNWDQFKLLLRAALQCAVVTQGGAGDLDLALSSWVLTSFFPDVDAEQTVEFFRMHAGCDFAVFAGVMERNFFNQLLGGTIETTKATNKC